MRFTSDEQRRAVMASIRNRRARRRRNIKLASLGAAVVAARVLRHPIIRLGARMGDVLTIRRVSRILRERLFRFQRPFQKVRAPVVHVR